MPKKYRIDTDKGSFIVETEDPQGPPMGDPSILAEQAARYPTAQEQGGRVGQAVQNSPLYGFAEEGRRNTGNLFGAIANTAPGTQTMGYDNPATAWMAAGIPGTATTEAMGQAAKEGPLVAALRRLVPSTASAGEKFQQVMGAAKDIPLDLSKADEAIARAQELRTRGSSFPKVFSDYVKNRKAAAGDFMSQPVTEPMTYEVGRDFASNASGLSSREATALNSKMHRQVAEFSSAMKTANREAAAKVGMGDLYDQAMKEYRQAKSAQDAAAVIKKYAVRGALGVALTGGGVALVKELTGQ